MEEWNIFMEKSVSLNQPIRGLLRSQSWYGLEEVIALEG